MAPYLGRTLQKDAVSFWLPLLDSPLKPLAACALRCAAGRGISSPGPENDAPHRFLYGPSSPTGSGWTRTNDTSQFAIVALRRRERLPCARCSLGFRLAASRTAGARLRPVNSRDAPAAQSRWRRRTNAVQKKRRPKGRRFFWLPLLDSPLKPLAACALRCAAGRGISSPGPENDAPHRFLYGPSSPTGSG